MARRKMSDIEFEQQYQRAVERGKETNKAEPHAQSVSYDRNSNRLVIEFKNGAMFAVPCDLLTELKGAGPDEIAEVTLLPRGAALHWEKLNQDFSIASLMANVFGHSVWFSELGRRGGAVSSEAKAAAARANGQKGGRPAKARERQGGLFEALLVKEVGLPFVHTASTRLASPPLATRDLIRLESEITREVLRSSSLPNALEGRMVGHEIFTVPGTSVLEYLEDGSRVSYCPVGIEEATNNAELALGA